MSQSENITRGDFPPNSNEHFLTLTAQLEEFFQRKKIHYPNTVQDVFLGTTIGPLHPNINMHLLLLVLYIFPFNVNKENSLAIKSIFCW